jgi:glycosyltransferase involved in cell wall biosynthesis
MGSDDLVTVVIPAYNAARTIDETLRSVRNQTHRRLEIIVVDDGSEDATSQIVEAHIAEDDRIRLIWQPNSGVAAARNRGIAKAKGDLIAPIDADDLWRIDKIERQLAALYRGGDAVGLVYTWSTIINQNGRIVDCPPGPIYEGFVLEKLFDGNICGNSSSVLMRKKAVLDAGGYDASLHARAAQGCEDYKLYLWIATKYEFSVEPHYLTGYRQLPMSMSSDVLQMLRSYDLIFEELCSKNIIPDTTRRKYRFCFLNYLYERALPTRRLLSILKIAAIIIREKPLSGGKLVVLTLIRKLEHKFTLKWRRSYLTKKSPSTFCTETRM